MTEAGIMPSLHRDLFIALGDPLGGGAWGVRIQYKPLIRLIWLGCLIMALGGIIAAVIAATGCGREAARRTLPLEGEPA